MLHVAGAQVERVGGDGTVRLRITRVEARIRTRRVTEEQTVRETVRRERVEFEDATRHSVPALLDLGLVRATIPAMVVLGPLTAAQYLVWHRRGRERTTREYRQASRWRRRPVGALDRRQQPCPHRFTGASRLGAPPRPGGRRPRGRGLLGGARAGRRQGRDLEPAAGGPGRGSGRVGRGRGLCCAAGPPGRRAAGPP